MRQFMGINGETFLFWNTKRAICSEIERFISVYRFAMDATRQGDDVAG